MMNNLFLKIYDFFQRHKVLRVLLPVVAALLLAASALTINYKEDITDFLPLDDNYRKSMKIVLSRAVEKHIQRKILTFENKTVVFN